MKRILAVVVLSISLSIAATLLARWVAVTVHTHRETGRLGSPETPTV
jgi:hypothetical protein